MLKQGPRCHPASPPFGKIVAKFGLRSLAFGLYLSSTEQGTAGFGRVWRSHLLPCVSAPADAREERRDLRGGAIGILAMREVSHSRKQREIEVGEGLVKPVGPGKRKQRVMLGPPDAGRHIDRSELWR